MRKKLVLITLSVVFSLAIIAGIVLPLYARATTTSTTSHKYVPSGDGAQKSITATVTWYGYTDNNGSGSSAIAYPKSDGNPTLHNQATEGTGTYTDPITFAAPSQDFKTSFPIGSIIYVPMVKKYFIMEDECADGNPEGCLNGANHADLWMGPDKAVSTSGLNACEDRATPDSPIPVIINPGATLAVDTEKIFTDSGDCTVHLYSATAPVTKSTPTPTPTSAAHPKPTKSTPTPTSESEPTPTPTPEAIQPYDLTPITTLSSPHPTSLTFDGFADADWVKAWQEMSHGAWGQSNMHAKTDSTSPAGQVLQVHYAARSSAPSCSDCASGGGQFYTSNTSFQSSKIIDLKYYLKFPVGFDWGGSDGNTSHEAGSLPGLYGGKTGCESGGNHCGGWSTRFSWGNGNSGGIYLYSQTQDSNSDGTNLGVGKWHYAADGKWHSLEQEVNLSTQSITVWYDNKQVFTTKVSGLSTISFSGIFFSTFYGGHSSGWGPKVATNAYFADFSLSTGTQNKNS